MSVCLRSTVFALAAAFVAACGLRTDPLPPEETAARAPADVRAVRTAAGVELEWKRPTQTQGGARLYDLARFVIERAGAGGRFEPIARIEVSDNDRIRVARRFRYVDDAAPPGPLRYRVYAVAEDGQVGIPAEASVADTKGGTSP